MCYIYWDFDKVIENSHTQDIVVVKFMIIIMKEMVMKFNMASKMRWKVRNERMIFEIDQIWCNVFEPKLFVS